MGKRYTPAEVRARLLETLNEGKPIIIGGAGDGFTAKLEEKGGVDIIGVYNSGKFRHYGGGSLCGLMPMGRSQDMVAEYAGEVCAQVKETPVIAGFCAQDPAMTGVSLTCAQTSPAYSATMSWLRPIGIR